MIALREHKLIAVIMGAPSTGVRAAEAARLLNAGFAVVRKKAPTAAAALGISPAKAAQLRKSSPASAPRHKIRSNAPHPKTDAARRTMKNRKADKLQPARASLAARRTAANPRQGIKPATTAQPQAKRHNPRQQAPAAPRKAPRNAS